MAEISVQFSNKINGYNKSEVNEYVKQAETKLQEKSYALATAQQQVEELQARLDKIIGEDVTVEEKIELYDKLMKKMDGDYRAILEPAIAKAKAIEAAAEKEYAARIDQARYSAEGIYVEAADRIAGVVDDNMTRALERLDRFLYDRTLVGRAKRFAKTCKRAAIKVSVAPKKAINKVKLSVATVKGKLSAGKSAQ